MARGSQYTSVSTLLTSLVSLVRSDTWAVSPSISVDLELEALLAAQGLLDGGLALFAEVVELHVRGPAPGAGKI